MKKVLIIIIVLFSFNSVLAQELVDSGINYVDAKDFIYRDNNEYVCKNGSYCMKDALLNNPERGFYTTNQLVLYRDDRKNKYLNPNSSNGSLIYLSVDLSDFSGAYHLNSDGSLGGDAELSRGALDALRVTLSNIKNNNKQVILRFVYDHYSDGIKDNEGYHNGDTVIVEPRQGMIIKHIEKLSPIINEFNEVIYTVQMGFYGAYGELHSTSMCTDKNINEALAKMIELTNYDANNPFISVRTPSRLRNYSGNNSRIAIYNDGYLGSSSDLGTYKSRDRELSSLKSLTERTPFGGEAVVNVDPDDDGNVSIIGKYNGKDNILYEMPITHTSYLNYEWRQEVHNEWAKMIYDRNDEYLNDSLLKYIEYHLGYRFVFRDIKLYDEVSKGNRLDIGVKIENVGFGNVLKKKKAFIYLLDNNDSVVYKKEINNDIMNYKAGTVSNDKISIDIPNDFNPGTYKVYLQFKIDDVAGRPYGSIRFANPDIWDDTIEANYIGSFNVIDNVPQVGDTFDGNTLNENTNNTVIEELVNVPPTGKKVIISSVIGVIMFIIGVTYLIKLKKNV